MTRILSIDVGIKNLSYCYLNTDKSKTQILDWGNLCVTEENSKKIKLENLTEEVLLTLQDNFDDDFEADVVLIENQPMLKNGMMKTVSVIIYTYFNMLKIQYGNIQEVRFISATNKLKCSKVDQNINKSNYKDRKKLSIQVAKLYLEKIAPDKISWFETHKKSDDFADSLNQAIFFIEKILKYEIL